MEKVKIIVLRVMVFFLVFAGVVIPIWYFYVTSEDPFFVRTDGVISTTIKVWLDTNGNGKRENDEPPLPHICVWSGQASLFLILGGWQNICNFQDSSTYLSGVRSEFLIGKSCSEIYIAINPPKDYFPTTPSIVNGCSAEFGLSKEKPIVEIKSQDVGVYLEKESQKEDMLLNMKIGVVVLLISVFSGLVSFKTINPVKSKAG